jgi:uncharacterized protein
MPMRPAPEDPRFSVWHAVAAYVAAFIFSTFCAQILIAVSGFGTEPDEWQLWFVAIVQVPLWVGLIGLTVLVSRRFGTANLRNDYGLGRPTWIDVAVGLPLGVAAQLVFVPLLYRGPLRFISSEELSEPARQLTEKATGWGVLLLGVVVVLGAPLIEELFFRGLLLRSLQARFSNWLALVVSSVLFGLAHFQLLQLPALVMFGLLAGVLAQRTKRLGMAIFAHVGFNLATVLVLTVELNR